MPWGKPVTLISKGLLGWRLRSNGHGACWKEAAGVLSNKAPCVDIISDGRYQDFKLHLEYKLEPGQRHGRVSCAAATRCSCIDDAGKPPSDEGTGAIHGLVVPGPQRRPVGRGLAAAGRHPGRPPGDAWC